MFEIETSDAIYETEFCHVQVNITSRCNMHCEHCRGAYSNEDWVDLNIGDFARLMEFSSEHMAPSCGILISGGEPLFHPHFKDLMGVVKRVAKQTTFVSITTNGSTLSSKHITMLQKLEFPELRISISLDSINAKRHDEFRRFPNAFNKALRAIELVATTQKIKCLVRASIQPDQIDEIRALAKLVESSGANVLSISGIIPVGNALLKPCLCFDKQSKKNLLDHVSSIKHEFPQMHIDVNDPLVYASSNPKNGEGEFGGCIAGIGSFSVEPNGSMLPCPVLPNQIIMNILNKSPEQIRQEYSSSDYVRKLMDRKFGGKCGVCSSLFTCGGCRARAMWKNGDFLGEDPDCWL